MMKARLAEMVGVTSRSITGFERGEISPSDETVAALSRALRFPQAFFAGPDIDEPLPETASFRAMSNMTAGQRDAALGAGALAVELSRWISSRFDLPEPKVPALRGTHPEAAADSVRGHWGLGERPIKNVVHLLESQGVRVFSLAEECAEVDAFSFWKQDTPFIFLNTMKSAERSRFDAAHELGHLVLHKHGGPVGRRAEREADQFASAFLMPRGSVLAAAPQLATVDLLIRLKKTWNVSVSALAHRLSDLGLLTEWHYRSICIEIAQRGFRKVEPEGGPRETSQVLHKVFTALREDGVAKADVARELLVHATELDSLVFGLVLLQIAGRPPTARA